MTMDCDKIRPCRRLVVACLPVVFLSGRGAAWTTPFFPRHRGGDSLGYGKRAPVGLSVFQLRTGALRRHPSRQPRRRLALLFATSTTPPSSGSNATTTENSTVPGDSQVGWRVGNVYNDLDRLERAMAYANAPQHLRQVEDRERLDTMARQRRVMHADVSRLFLCTLLSQLLVLVALGRRELTKGLFLYHNVHFWLGTVVAPLWMLARKPRPVAEPLPHELRGLDPDYYKFVMTDWEDPRTSCRDHVLCLLEQWTSAVAGAALVGLMFPLGFWWMGMRTLSHGSPLPFLLPLAQTITRLGALASLHQYPKLLYQLNRHHQPRPMDRQTLQLRTLVRWTLRLAPFNVALDLVQMMSRLPSMYMGVLSTWIGASALKYWLFGMGRKRIRPVRARRAMTESLWGLLLSTAQVMCMTLAVLGVSQRLLRLPPHSRTVATTSWLVLNGLWFALSTIAPAIHLLAIRKLFRFSYTHDISLANDYDTIAAMLSNPTKLETRFQYRYRLAWREPQRLSRTLSSWQGGFLYWLLCEGGVEDQLRKEFQSNQKGEAVKRGLSVLQKCEQDIAANPDAPRPNSLEWKEKAMQRLAAKHEENYRNGFFEDPLGVAVQQTFGIGIGYNFDHMADLKPGEAETSSRLQARAAKSAIRRVQEIYNAESAQRQLDSVTDPVQREQQKINMRKAAEDEIQFLARRLSDLIPTDSTMDLDRQTQVQQYLKRRDYKRTSDHEMVVGSSPDESSSLNSLLGRGKGESQQKDEEFLDAWLKRQGRGDADDSVALV